MDAFGYVERSDIMLIAHTWYAPISQGGLGATPPCRSVANLDRGEGVSSRMVLSAMRIHTSKPVFGYREEERLRDTLDHLEGADA